MMSYIFISYSSKDSSEVRTLANALLDEEINVWIDYMNIAGGENWALAVQEGIEKADVFLVYVSNSYMTSQHVITELRFALQRKIQIIPVIDQNYDVTSLPLDLSAYMLIDINDDDYISKIKHILPETVMNNLTSEQVMKTHERPAKGYIFVSYSVENIDFTLKLRKFFEKKGYAYWDYQHSHRKYDMPFHLELEQAITDCAAVVSVVSPDWKHSKWSTREYLFSEQVGKTNFVCIVENVGPTLLYADKTFIEFFHDEDAGFDKLDKALRREGLID